MVAKSLAAQSPSHLAAFLACVATAAASLMCQSCAVPSVYAVAPDAPAADAQWATGEWVLTPESPTAKDGSAYVANVVAIGGGRFLIDWKPRDGPGSPDMPPLSLVARPFELAGRLFADVTLQQGLIQELAKKYPAFLIPTHVLVRIDRDTADSATLALPTYGKARDLAARQQRSLPMAMSESDSDVALALTGDSESVTKFYEANAGSDELFGLRMQFQRVKPAQPASPGGR